ncbi:MAG: outer membrane protein assembly factor BamE [Rhodocyclaceae bacterium]|nr:outer membrane protein assembly factor BamE [Rhodocyclaceae bacterium]
MKHIPWFALPLVISACSTAPDINITSSLSPYKIDVRQGNFVSQEMVASLKPGMSRDQVRFILGTPMVADIFHADRWDYVYRLQPGKGELQQRRLVVFFQDGKLVRVGGDVVANDPSAPDAAAEKPAPRVIEIAPAESKKEAEAKSEGSEKNAAGSAAAQ